MDVKIAPYIVS